MGVGGAGRNPRVSHKAEGKGNSEQELSLWSLWEGTGEAGEAGSGLASLNNFRALGHSDCPQLSDTWPWVIRAGVSGPSARAP